MITKNKINRQAKAVLELYKTLPEKTRMEIKKLILEDEISFEEVEESSELSQLSEKSLEKVWDSPENEHWDEWNCYKKMDSKLNQIMQPVLVFGLNNLAFPPVFGSPA